MPCQRCENGKWKWGSTGPCTYDSEADCKAANEGKAHVTGLSKMMSSPWALLPAKFAEIHEVYNRHLRGEKGAEVEQSVKLFGLPEVEPTPLEIVEGVGIVTIEGVLSKKMNLLHRISGGASTALIGRDFKEAMTEKKVKSILLVIDSPGGAVDGTQELARMIFENRGTKPIVAFTDGMMASAAYWIGAAADQLFISSNTTEVGSIGVVATHVDISRAEEMKGIKTTEIVAGKFKRIGSPHGALSEVGKDTIQDMVNFVYKAFVEDVAEFRAVSEEDVLEGMADGRIFIGKQAVRAGLVDEVKTFDQVLTHMQALGNQKRGDKMGKKAEGESLSTDQEREEMMKEAEDKGFMRGLSEGTKAGLDEGAEAERERIQSVEAQSMPGHEKLIQELKFDGKTTGAEAAIKVINAERTIRENMANSLYVDSPPVVKTPEPPVGSESKETKIDQAVKAYQDEYKVEYKEAVVAVSKEQPALFENR